MAGIKCDRFKKQNENKTKQKKTEQIALRSGAKRAQRCVHAAPPSCLPVGSPNFSHEQGRGKTKNKNQPCKIRLKHFWALRRSLRASDSPAWSLARQLWEKTRARPPEPNLPDTEPNSALEKPAKTPINGCKPCVVFRRAGNRKFNPANWWLEERKPTLKAVIRPSTIPPLWAF